MESGRLDFLIDEFESMVRRATALFALTTYDWRPFYEKAKEIQLGFNSHVHYPTKREREEAWVRFNESRTHFYKHVRERSEALRNEIVNSVKSAGYSRLTDVMFFFMPTTIEDMKNKGALLKEAGQALSKNKHRMLKEHKDECFARILELQQTHDIFWNQYNELRAARRQEFVQKARDFAQRMRNNIRTNQEKLDKALTAYENVRANLGSNVEKLDSAYSAGFAARVAQWIEEDKEKLQSISESIAMIKGWIEEDRARLHDVESREYR